MRKTGSVVLLLIALSVFLCHADTAVKEDGREIGQGLKKLGKDTGTAFKEGGKEVGQGFKKVGKESGHAAKKAGKSMGEWFRDMGHSIKAFFNDRFSTTK